MHSKVSITFDNASVQDSWSLDKRSSFLPFVAGLVNQKATPYSPCQRKTSLTPSLFSARENFAPHLWPVISVALALHFTCFVLNFWTKSITLIPYWSCARKKIISVANYLQHLKQGSPRAVPVTSRIKELVSKDHLIRVPVLNALQSCGCAVKGYSWVYSLPYEFRCSFREDFMEKSLEAVGGMKSLAASFSLREERCQGMSCQPVR